MQMRAYALDPNRTKFSIMDFVPKRVIEETPTVKKAPKPKLMQQMMTKDYIDEPLELSDDEEHAIALYLDEAQKKKVEEERRIEKEKEAARQIHKNQADEVKNELEALIRIADKVNTRKQSEIKASTDGGGSDSSTPRSKKKPKRKGSATGSNKKKRAGSAKRSNSVESLSQKDSSKHSNRDLKNDSSAEELNAALGSGLMAQLDIKKDNSKGRKSVMPNKSKKL